MLYITPWDVIKLVARKALPVVLAILGAALVFYQRWWSVPLGLLAWAAVPYLEAK